MRSNRVNLPESIDKFRYIIVRYDRDANRYEMIEPCRVNSYDLGNFFDANLYFKQIGKQAIGERVISCALNFGAAMCIIAEGRSFGLDLTRFNLETGISANVDIDENRRSVDDDDDDLNVFIPSGDAIVPKTRTKL